MLRATKHKAHRTAMGFVVYGVLSFIIELL
jgi:preprotein translocase subunit Sss1